MLESWRFDYFTSFAFWGAVAAAAVLVRLAAGHARARGLLLLASSSALLLAIPRFQLRGLLLVWGMAALSWAAARWLTAADPAAQARSRRAVAVLGVLVVLGFLAVFKYHFLQALLVDGRQGPSGHVFLVGASYFSFKAIHVLVEAYKGSLKRVEGLSYLNYITFFPAFISGPINRYAPFAEQLGAARPATLRQDLAAGGERIVHGLFKKLVLVQVVAPYLITARPLAQQSPWEIVVGLHAYALFSYFDFSGYSDLAVGAARVVGLELPENFNWPFLQKNIRELWTNWHMSLTSWLVDYVYWPVVRKLRNLEFFRARPVLLSVVGMNVTFLACGAWHGEALNFVVWGAYHGLGISVVNVYQRQKRRIPSATLQRYFASPASRVVGAIGTYHFFTLGIALFALDLEQLRGLFSILFRQVAP